MRANEIFIGAYVKALGQTRKVKSIVSKDTGVEVSFEGKNPVIVSLYEIEPVELTAEILLKNGFGDEEMSDDYYGDEIQIDLSLDEWTHEEESGAIISGYGKRIEYVHEFQHALRLCGIEKEIVL